MSRLSEATVPDDFLAGGSEMATLVRSKDWSQTPLGAIATWPQSLRTTVSLCLASNFPINIIWGNDHSQIYNDGYRVVCGDAHPEALGRSYREVWASAWPAIGDPFEGALKGETSFLENQRMFLTRNGYLEETFFTFSLSPIRDEGGGIEGLFHPVTETTANMLSERRTRALRDLTEELGTAATTAELATATIETLRRYEFDLPFLFLYAWDEDAACYTLAGQFGVAEDAAIARTLGPLSTQPWPLDQATVSRGPFGVDDLDRRLGDLACGPYDESPSAAFAIPVHLSGAPQPALVAFAGVSPRLPLNDDYRGFYDLIAATLAAAWTSVRAREDERRRTEALAAIDRAKTAFFSNVSHEFRTPLTLMLGPIEDALDDPMLPAAQRDRLDISHRNALRLLKLVNALLDFSRIEAGRMEARFAPVDLAALTADLASNFRSACERVGIGLVVDTPPLSRPVHVDHDMWEKIVLNLLSNAFKFTLEGQIRVALHEAGGRAVLSVQDTGVGVPADELPRIFDRFHRIDGQRGRSQEGTGIGLALVQELVELHRGTIAATSQIEQGTTFVVSIPMASEHLSADAATNPAALSSTGVRASAFVEEALRWLPLDKEDAPEPRPVDRPADRTTAPRIILADDNADMRGYIRQILEDAGYQVEAVANGRLALEALRRGPRAELVLSDVMMPELDGFGLLEAVRADASLDGMLVILLSARAGEEARIEGLAAGADDYLVKPFGSRELRARVDGAINLSRQRQQAAAREAQLQTQIVAERGRNQLKQTQMELEFALESGRLGSWDVDLLDHSLNASPLCRQVFGFAKDEPYSYAALIDRIDPRDRDMRATRIAEAIANHADLDIEYRIERPGGELAWIMIRGRAKYDDSGRAIGLAGVSLDITERKQAEERRLLLLDELNHRVKNTLATVQSITKQTRRTARDPDQFVEALEARIQALAGTHSLLTKTSWDGVMLADVIDQTLAPYAADTSVSHHIETGGPRLRLEPNAAVTLNMAFHELATNAAKYGSFSAAGGLVQVTWRIDDSRIPPVVAVEWRESGGPPVVAPTMRGFGSRLLERGLAHELGGSVELDYQPSGLVCRMAFPATGKIEIISS